jgi:Putative transmembrane protein (Alph_Pro_TM)
MADWAASCKKVLGLAVLLAVFCLTKTAGAASPEFQLVPRVLEIGAFFQGEAVTVTGSIPAGTEAIVEVLGRTGHETLMRKGRRGGLWMNVGEMDIKGAPSLYLVMSTSPDLLSASEAEVPWGFPAIKRHITLAGDLKANEQAEFQAQFLDLKESEGLYAALPGALKVSRAEGGRASLRGTFHLPANVKPDTYKVCLSVIRQGQVLDKQCNDFTVKMVGFPSLLSTLAYEHGAFYGILAVVIAIFTGFSMGYLFKGGGGH